MVACVHKTEQRRTIEQRFRWYGHSLFLKFWGQCIKLTSLVRSTKPMWRESCCFWMGRYDDLCCQTLWQCQKFKLSSWFVYSNFCEEAWI